MMRLIDLDPRLSAVHVNDGATYSSVPTGELTLDFNCPTCGSPRRIELLLGASVTDSPRRWTWDTPLHDMPMTRWTWWQSEPPDDEQINRKVRAWLHQLTLTPSINNTQAGHGPHRPPCKWHGNIAVGGISFAA